MIGGKDDDDVMLKKFMVVGAVSVAVFLLWFSWLMPDDWFIRAIDQRYGEDKRTPVRDLASFNDILRKAEASLVRGKCGLEHATTMVVGAAKIFAPEFDLGREVVAKELLDRLEASGASDDVVSAARIEFSSMLKHGVGK